MIVQAGPLHIVYNSSWYAGEVLLENEHLGVLLHQEDFQGF